MKRSLGWNCQWAAYAFAWLLAGGNGATAESPGQQNWQPTPVNAPSYPPSTNPAGSYPDAAAPPSGQYHYSQQPDQPVGPPQYPGIAPRPPGNGQPAYPSQPSDNRWANPPQDPRRPAGPVPGQPVAGQPTPGQPIQGPPVRNTPPQAPFVLSAEEAATLDRLLADWEKRDKEIHDMESDFYRWRYDGVFKADQPPAAEPGVLKYVAPDKGLMRIDAKDPTQSEQWACDGKSIYQFDYQRKQVTEFVMPPELQGKGIGDGPLPFVFGIEAQKLKQRYFMRIITPSDVQNQVWLEAYPRYQQQAAEFSKVEVILKIGAEKTLFPYAIQIYSPNGKDRTVYQLQNPKINRSKIVILMNGEWWKPSIPFGWKSKTEMPPPPIEAGLRPSMQPRQ